MRVTGCALAARAAQQLQDGSGIASTTLDRLLNDLSMGRRTLGPDDVVVVDEAGMVGTRQLEALVSRAARSRAKVVLVGDPSQLPAIDAGGALTGLARRLRAHHLTENHRQTEDWERRVLRELRGAPTEGVGATYERHGRLDLADDGIDRVVDRWWHSRQDDRDVLLLAGRRDQVRELNQAIRERLSADGAIGPDRWAANGRHFAVGDEVIALRNDDHIGVLNGTRGTITGGNQRKLTIETADHRQVTIPIDYLDAGHLDHGYALTIHKAQGLTADETIVLGDETLAREHTYVALSRGRLGNHLSIAIADAFDDHPAEPPDDRTPSQRLDHMTSRSAAEDMGIDQW
jgi:ATP-dependent exoDNAse (exonuclease V) alpha subunit